MAMTMRILAYLLLSLSPSSRFYSSSAYNPVLDPFRRLQNDYRALRRFVTARHIELPPGAEDAAVALKRKIRDACVDQERFVVDVFEDAARKYSRDESTRENGGLIGSLVPQGYCARRCPEIDRACFRVGLGEVEGPIQSNRGVHLLLVSERTNCPKLDGRNTKLVRTSNADVFGTLVPSDQGRIGSVDIGKFAIYWLAVFIAGGILAEVVAQFTS